MYRKIFFLFLFLGVAVNVYAFEIPTVGDEIQTETRNANQHTGRDLIECRDIMNGFVRGVNKNFEICYNSNFEEYDLFNCNENVSGLTTVDKNGIVYVCKDNGPLDPGDWEVAPMDECNHVNTNKLRVRNNKIQRCTSNWQNSNVTNHQVFTSDTTITVPAGIHKIFVYVIGGGAGSAGQNRYERHRTECETTCN